MADPKPKSAPSPKVSPTRNAVSLLLLLVVGVISVIELRAGFGHMMTAKAMAAKATDGEFDGVSLEEAKGMVLLFPSETVNTREADSTYTYEWVSVLRPLMQKKSPQIVVVASNEEKPVALAFSTETLEDEPRPDPASSGAPAPSMPAGMSGMGGPGMGGPGMGGPGMGGGEKSGGRPPMEGDEAGAPPADAPAAIAPTVAPPSVPGSAAPAPADATPAETPAPSDAAPPAADAAAPAEPAVDAAPK